MYILCTDLESCYIPEIWIRVAEKTGIDELKITTRDEPDYNKLMTRRLKILKENNLKLKDIQNIISHMDPIPGAKKFLDWVRSKTQLIIVSDTFKEFAGPFMKKLGMPTIFCHELEVDDEGNITGYNLRQPNAKKKVIHAMKSLNYKVVAVGDSHNDVLMLKDADQAVLLHAAEKVKDEFPNIPAANNYDELKEILKEYF